MLTHARWSNWMAGVPVVMALGWPAAAAWASEAAEPRARQVYEATCAACHGSGVANAPRLGDKARWARLKREGQVHVTAHGWLGDGAMPARGGQADLPLQAFADAVVYMARGSGVAWPYADEAVLKRLQREIESEQRKKKP